MSRYRTFDLGRVLSLGFGVWGRNVITFVGLSALIHLPLLAFFVWARYAFQPALLDAESSEALAESMGDWMLSAAPWLIAAVALQWILTGILHAAVVFGAVQAMRGDAITIGGCIGAALTRLFPVLAVTLIAAVCTVVGYFLLIVPGVYLSVIWWVAVPALMTEGIGPTTALS
ncbi:MAG: hypothetical protein OER88_13115, partial [Planctomycetota bacterium]|nr:hypothetical protein [Planctomycetota bacterium]